MANQEIAIYNLNLSENLTIATVDLQFKHLTRVSNNLDVSIKFYEDLLGFRLVEKIETGDVNDIAVMEFEDTKFYLKSTQEPVKNPESIQKTSDHWAFALTDFRHAEEALQKKDIPFLSVSIDAKAGKPAVRQTFFQDPDGHLLEIVLVPTEKFVTQRKASSLQVSYLHHITRNVAISQLREMTSFYEQLLGFRQIARPNFDDPGAWFRNGNIEMHLIGVTKIEAVDKDFEAARNSWAFYTVKINKVKSKLEEGDFDFLTPNSEKSNLFLNDTSGKLLEIFEDILQ